MQNNIQCNNNIQKNIHDAKSTWKVINKILKPNSKRRNDFQIEENGTKLGDSTEIANAFNDYFSFIAPSLAAEIPDVGISACGFLGFYPETHIPLFTLKLTLQKSRNKSYHLNLNLLTLSLFLPLPINALLMFSPLY